MRTALDDTRLTVTDEQGRSKTIDFATYPCGPDLQQALAKRAHALTRGSGTWNTIVTMDGGLGAVRSFLAQRHCGSARDLTSADLRRYWLSLSATSRAKAGQSLKTFFGEMEGLPEDVTRALRFVPSVARDGETKTKITLDEQQVELVRRRAIDDLKRARDRIKAGWALVDRFQSGDITEGNPDHAYAKVLHEIATTGDISDRYPSNHRQRRVPREVLTRVHGSGTSRTSTHACFAALFMTSNEGAAALIALTATCGWNLSVATSVSTAGMSRVDAGDGSEPVHLRVTLTKPRRGGVDTWSETYMDTGPRSKVYVLNLIYECTVGARRVQRTLGYDEEALLVVLPDNLNAKRHATTAAPLFALTAMDRRTVANYLAKWRAADEDDLSFVSPRWLRQHFVTVQHPQGHSPAMNDDYVLADEGVRREALPTIEQGITEAMTSLSATLVNDVIAKPEDAPIAAAHGTLDLLNDGALDAVVSACQDPDDSPITGGRCGASLLMCFACRNAVVLRRHLPRNWVLWDRLEALRTVMDASTWASRWSTHHTRLSDLLTPDRYFDTETLEQARNARTPADEQVVDRLLRREWDVA